MGWFHIKRPLAAAAVSTLVTGTAVIALSGTALADADGDPNAEAAPQATAATTNADAAPAAQANANATVAAAQAPTPTSVTPQQPDASASADHSQGNAGTSGVYNQAQPPSTADQNAGGANGGCLSTDTSTNGIYCSTRSGAPSFNGGGTGQSVGKPCAGCVGKADNKNPPGQETANPLGTFPNNGYECDHNNGIGKTNPAHTGCRNGAVTPTCIPTAENNNCQPPCVPTEANNNCGSGNNGGTTACVPSAANNFCATVQGTTVEGASVSRQPSTVPVASVTTKTTSTPKKKPVVLGERVAKTPNRTPARTPAALPFTGDRSGLLLTAALIALATGLALQFAAQRPGSTRS